MVAIVGFFYTTVSAMLNRVQARKFSPNQSNYYKYEKEDSELSSF